MLGHRAYLDTLCPGGCGQPRDLAHHWDNEGWYEATPTVCHACTALADASNDGDEPTKPVELLTVASVRDYDKKPLPPMPVKTARGGAR